MTVWTWGHWLFLRGRESWLSFFWTENRRNAKHHSIWRTSAWHVFFWDCFIALPSKSMTVWTWGDWTFWWGFSDRAWTHVCTYQVCVCVRSRVCVHIWVCIYGYQVCVCKLTCSIVRFQTIVNMETKHREKGAATCALWDLNSVPVNPCRKRALTFPTHLNCNPRCYKNDNRKRSVFPEFQSYTQKLNGIEKKRKSTQTLHPHELSIVTASEAK